MIDDTSAWENVTFLGSVRAGFPSPADDWKERPLHLHDLVVQHPLSTYFMRVSGDSMTGACMYPGDLIVVDRSLTATHKKIVVARLGKSFTLKRLLMGKRDIVLKPENPQYMPIDVTGRKDFEIWGVVTYVVHKAS